MTADTHQKTQKIIAYCDEKWLEANGAPATDWPPPDLQTGQKIAYNDVLRFARKLLTETP